MTEYQTKFLFTVFYRIFIYLFSCNFHGGSDVRGDTGGFVASEGGVFGDVGVKIDQGISASLGCQTVAVNDIWQR